MGIKVALEHRTSYTFDRLVEVYPHVIRLRPAPHSAPRSRRTPWRSNPPTTSSTGRDAFGNFLARVVFRTARRLSITVGLIADMKVINPFDFFIEDTPRPYPFAYPKALGGPGPICVRSTRPEDDGSGPRRTRPEWVRNFP